MSEYIKIYIQQEKKKLDKLREEYREDEVW